MNVYDFDGTIYDGESSVEFILEFVKHDPKILKYVPKLFSLLPRYAMGKIEFEEFKQKYSPILVEYFKHCDIDLQQLVKPFWDKHEKQIKSFYKDIQKEDDVIITASPEFMMHDICERIGVKNLIASDFDIKTGEVKKACFRKDKIPCFREAFPDAEIDDFYTDSVNDEFLFPLAKRVFMVKGNKVKQIK